MCYQRAAQGRDKAIAEAPPALDGDLAQVGKVTQVRRELSRGFGVALRIASMRLPDESGRRAQRRGTARGVYRPRSNR